jgi:hypothetical protein
VYSFFSYKEGYETNDYAYLEPVTPENAITDATLDKVVDLVIQLKPPRASLSYSQNESYKTSLKNHMKKNTITEVEGKYYIANSSWPVNRFTQKYLDYFKSLPEYKTAWDDRLSNQQNTNRDILNNLYNFQGYLKPGSKKIFDSIPEGKILNGYNTSKTRKLFCATGTMHQADKDKASKKYMVNRQVVDIKTLPTLVPGFQFINEPCDPCKWQKCRFSMDKQPTSELFSTIWGLNNMSSISTTSPSSKPSTIASQNVKPDSFPLFGSATTASPSSSSTATTLSANDQKISDAKANTAEANAEIAQANAAKAKADASKAQTDADNAKKPKNMFGF